MAPAPVLKELEVFSDELAYDPLLPRRIVTVRVSSRFEGRGQTLPFQREAD
jgi:hypothetical protein